MTHIDNSTYLSIYNEGFEAGFKEGLHRVEITEHHTFAKPDDVDNIDFPNSNCSEDK